MNCSSPKLKPNAADALIAAAVLLLALFVFLRVAPGGAPDGALTAAVSIDGQTVDRLELSRPQEKVYTANGYTLRVVAEGGGVRVAEADCPTQVCVRTGTISRPGQSIVCLPARLCVTVEGAPDGYDIAAG